MSKTRNDLVNHPDQASLLDVPSDVIKLMSAQEKLTTQTVSHLAQSCTTLHRMFKPQLNEQLNIQMEKLLRHIVYGELDAASEMIHQQPGLLLHRGTVIDPVGRKIINVTPFQCALGAGDVGMWRMILPFFDRLKSVNPENERQEQFNQLFPADWQPTPVYDFDELFRFIHSSSLVGISAALENEKNDSALCQKLAGFREAIYTDVANSGMHFNQQLLIDAYCFYDDVYDICNQAQRDLIWRQVIGYVQSLLPACKAHLLAQGLNDLIVNRSGVRRTLQLNDSGANYYTLTDHKNGTGLGFDVAIVASLGGVFASSFCCEIEARELKKLFRRDAEAFEALRERFQGVSSQKRREV